MYASIITSCDQSEKRYEANIAPKMDISMKPKRRRPKEASSCAKERERAEKERSERESEECGVPPLQKRAYLH